MKKRINILADVPFGVSHEELKAYVTEALEIWGGQKRPPGGYSPEDPGDPLFGSIKIEEITITKGRKTNVQE